MKVIAKKILYEQDLYQYPDENTSYGLFPKEKHGMFIFPIRKCPVLVHKKGEIKEWKFVTEESCCTPMRKAIEAEQITFLEPVYLEHNNRNSEEKLQFLIQSIGAFVTCACWPIQLMKIHFCPFCGKKIEIEGKK